MTTQLGNTSGQPHCCVCSWLKPDRRGRGVHFAWIAAVHARLSQEQRSVTHPGPVPATSSTDQQAHVAPQAGTSTSLCLPSKGLKQLNYNLEKSKPIGKVVFVRDNSAGRPSGRTRFSSSVSPQTHERSGWTRCSSPCWQQQRENHQGN